MEPNVLYLKTVAQYLAIGGMNKMKFSTIERNPETKQLEAVFSFNDRVTITIPFNDSIIDMIKNSAEELSPGNACELVTSFYERLRDLETYTKYRRKIMSNMDINTNSNAVFKLIASGETLTMNEIYWFDWFWIFSLCLKN